MQVTRDYDEEEQGYDSEKEREAKYSDDSGSSPARYEGDTEGDSTKHTPKQAKQNGDDHHEEQDMDVSDWDLRRNRMNFNRGISSFDLLSRLCVLYSAQNLALLFLIIAPMIIWFQ